MARAVKAYGYKLPPYFRELDLAKENESILKDITRQYIASKTGRFVSGKAGMPIIVPRAENAPLLYDIVSELEPFNPKEKQKVDKLIAEAEEGTISEDNLLKKLEQIINKAVKEASKQPTISSSTTTPSRGVEYEVVWTTKDGNPTRNHTSLASHLNRALGSETYDKQDKLDVLIPAAINLYNSTGKTYEGFTVNEIHRK